MKTLLLVFAVLVLAQGANAADENLKKPEISAIPPKIQREFRGVWVASVANIDWPSKPGLSSAVQQEELLAILDRAKKLNLNAVILQVRPACDALYASKIEPWSEYLTGEMGKAPEPFYDPLEFAVAEAHKRCLELHAWINPYRAKHPTAKSAISTNHVSKVHPEMCLEYGRHLWLNPGSKAVQDYTISVVMDIVKRYDIDGLHLDDYFYPYQEKDDDKQLIDFPDEEVFMNYVADGGLESREDWRRGNVNTLIERTYNAIKAEKPHVKFGISPFGIWQPGYPEGIKGMNSYQAIYCDSRKWLTNGWLDYIAPQLYWKIDATEQSYPVLLKWWSEQNIRGRHLWAGNFTSRVDEQWKTEEILDQIKVTREQAGANGNIHFSMKALMQNRGNLSDELLRTVYQEPALIPASPWLNRGNAPGQPALEVKRDSKEMKVAWKAIDNGSVWQWVLQKRVAGKWQTEVCPAQEMARTISATEAGLPDAVVLLAINRCGLASAPAVFNQAAETR